MKRRRSASVIANSRILFDAEVCDSASSCSRGEDIPRLSENPGGESSATRSRPRRARNGAAAASSAKAARKAAERAARKRKAAILSAGSRIIGIVGEQELGDDP